MASLNLEKYADTPIEDIPLDPKPRIINIVRELEEEHGWTWPQQPHRDWEKSRASKRRKWSCLYSKECLDISSILALIIGPWEILVAVGFIILPKTFVPALRESSEFCIIFVALFFFQGFKHTFVALLGLGLRSMHPYLIGFVHVSWPYETVWPLFGIFISAVGFYTTQRRRVLREMNLHLSSYTTHWFSMAGWDHYQSFMRCCGVESFKDWRKHGPTLRPFDGKARLVPDSCCSGGSSGCVSDPKEGNVHSWGCLEMTSVTLDIIFISGTICMVIGVVLGILGYKSLREAEDCVGDPIHTVLFQPSSGSSMGKEEVESGIGIESKSLRRAELLSLLDHYCLLQGKEMGLDEEVRKAREQLGLGPGEGSKSKSGSKGAKRAKSKTAEKVKEVGGGSPQDGEEEVPREEEDTAPKPPRLTRTPRIHPIPPQPLRLAPKLIISTVGDAGVDVPSPNPVIKDMALLALGNDSIPEVEEESPGTLQGKKSEPVLEESESMGNNPFLEAETDASDEDGKDTDKSDAKKNEESDNENVESDSILDAINF